MILIVGGIASGKRTFARMLGFEDGDLSRDAGDMRPVVFDVQELVRDECDVRALADRLAKEKSVVIACEVGSGIVPLSSEERAWRDRAGNLMEQLADRAECVVRMVCGIPLCLKGAIPERRS